MTTDGRSEYKRRWYRENAVKLRATNRARRALRTVEEREAAKRANVARVKMWREGNREKHRQHCANWRERNLEYSRAYQREYRRRKREQQQ
ncbi:MAG: hypothetical protein KC492_08820 [Myxococcales bacterium]|nr:hypothetical protein [Myxococcales bacterium]